MSLSWGNGADLVEGELLGQGKGSGVGNFMVSLKKDSRQSVRPRAKHRVHTHKTRSVHKGEGRLQHGISFLSYELPKCR